MTEPIYAEDPLKHKKVFVGFIKTNPYGLLYLEKDVKESVHRFKKYDGYAIQFDEFQKLREKISIIKINETDTGETYLSTIVNWVEKGMLIDEGHGKQWLLPRNLMYKVLKE